MSKLAFSIVLAILLSANGSATETVWAPAIPATITDDDMARHAGEPDFLTGIAVTQSRFAENGFNWHLIRFTNAAKPDGPLWVAPHDDENAAFDAMIAALRIYGGTGIAVNSGPGSERRQSGRGRCGVQAEVKPSCDPNRNFSTYSPIFTAAILDHTLPNQPIIALHTNSPGFQGDGQGGYGDVTILDARAFRNGNIRPRADGTFGINQPPELANYDTLGLVPFRGTQGVSNVKMAACGAALSKAGVHFWAERVGRSDGSLSNYIALNLPDLAYFNAESRREVEYSVAAARHLLMVAAYLRNCR